MFNGPKPGKMIYAINWTTGRYLLLSCLSWKWRKRSSVKITERTYEEGTEAFRTEEKVAILKRHLVDKVPVSDLCADSDEGNQYSGLIVISIPGWCDQSSERSDAGFCIL